ncbi:Uu.00g136410.m01.CDS01 [Anthostomella pinea]|uniref:Uu.00g136410.m01.CDS01 n=1 Tax=Anthostomella pinea TaxID=933095 RepID=A0AAI8VPD4_9PEZI|nr:Uu.00g136410.m01.CDS01 [Anthostomella pinea]
MDLSAQFQSQDEALGNSVLTRAGLQPAGHVASCVADQEIQDNTSIIVTYLLEQVEEYRTLANLRRQGWENPAGDKFFRKQRRNADKADAHTSRHHFKLMQRIGNGVHKVTSGFAISRFAGTVLDMCAAPGGFLATALKLNPDATATGFSLPPSEGGYSILLNEDDRYCVKFLDVTMLAEDLGVTSIPSEHPDVRSFLPRQIEETRLFDLVLCDGQVLRTQNRAPYRETREPARLKNAQLALGLEHTRPGGTMIVLFHNVEAWDTVCFLHTFNKFSFIQLHKPCEGHTTRSSFYMVATKVQSQNHEAVLAIKKWKDLWKTATFGTDGEFAESLRKGEPTAKEILGEFGLELVRMGRGVWSTQADALARAPYIFSQPACTPES